MIHVPSGDTLNEPIQGNFHKLRRFTHRAGCLPGYSMTWARQGEEKGQKRREARKDGAREGKKGKWLQLRRVDGCGYLIEKVEKWKSPRKLQ